MASSQDSSYPACSVICQENIPANSLARIVSYNRKADCYLVKKPDADSISLSQLVWVPDAIPAMHDTVDHDFAIEPLKPDQQWNWEEYWGWFTDLNAKARVS